MLAAVAEFFSPLAYPLTQGLLLAALGLVLLRLRRPRGGFCLLSLGFGWLYLCATGVFASFLMDLLERDFTPRAMSVIQPADAIVLLGGAMRGDTHMGTLPDLNQQADRLVAAVALYRMGKAPVLVLSGGGPAGDRPEAEQMRDLLRVMGVPDSAMVLESRSRDTHDNAVYTADILQERGWRRVLLVTSAFHMRRAQAAFAAQGVDVTPAPTDYQRLVTGSSWPGLTPGIKNLQRTTLAFHELIGFVVYRARGWI